MAERAEWGRESPATENDCGLALEGSERASLSLRARVKFACELPELDAFPALSFFSFVAATTTHFSRHKAERERERERERSAAKVEFGGVKKGLTENVGGEGGRRRRKRRGTARSPAHREVCLSIRVVVPVASAVRRIVKKGASLPSCHRINGRIRFFSSHKRGQGGREGRKEGAVFRVSYGGRSPRGAHGRKVMADV